MEPLHAHGPIVARRGPGRMSGLEDSAVVVAGMPATNWTRARSTSITVPTRLASQARSLLATRYISGHGGSPSDPRTRAPAVLR